MSETSYWSNLPQSHMIFSNLFPFSENSKSHILTELFKKLCIYETDIKQEPYLEFGILRLEDSEGMVSNQEKHQ